MSQEKDPKEIGCLPYVIGGLSFIPLIGVLFGLISITIGIVKIKIGGWRLILVGTLGIMLTIGIYGTLYYKGFIERGGTFDALSTQLARSQLTDLVKHIEYYKIQNGNYPSSLKVFERPLNKNPNTFVFVTDTMRKDFRSGELPLYYYELLNEGANYYLFSSGIDGVPFTADDVHPAVSDEELKNIGYMRKQ